ncbi:MAG: leucyl/phenylalanyl-tRNA--protein transferase [Desulfobacteraceae bacterium]|nr:leucyl/phenylalanyl-tRNA--protein transferase [Desulfobacteraceae bacterium]
MPVFALSDDFVFPPAHLATEQGLLAIGGDLRPERLLKAYQNGIFPWYSECDPILWWSPDPRMVLYPDQFIISRSLKRIIRQRKFSYSIDQKFVDVITQCAKTRISNGQGTWITGEMLEAYITLYKLGYGHSVEVFHDGRLAGGLYGVSLGGCFFGESMFSLVSNASKVALAHLCNFLLKHSFHMIDCQMHTTHLEKLGAFDISRNHFMKQLKQSMQKTTLVGNWSDIP